MSSITRQPETISEVGEVVNVSSVDLVDEVTNVTSVDTVDLVTTVSEVSNVTSVDTVDTVTEVANVTSVDTVDTLTAITNPVITLDHLLEVAQGNITGQSLIHKFGWAEDIDTGAFFAVWDGKSDTGNMPDTDYTWPSDTAATFYIASDNNGDTQDYEIQGLDATFAAQTKEVTAQGTTPTAIPGTWTRTFRVKNKGATDNAGIIFITKADDHTAGVPDVDTDITAIITPGNNQTLMALYTVPVATTAYLLRTYYSCGKGEDFQLNLCARPTGGVFQIKDKQFLYQRYMENDFEGGVSFAAKTDILAKAQSVTTTNKPVAAGFDLLLVAD